MSTGPTPPADLASTGDYAWAIATRFPPQGAWSENDYFALLDQSGSKGFELVDGQIEVLPVPTRIHQLLSRYLFLALNAFVEARSLGETHFSGLRLRIRPGQIREPDVLFLSADRLHLAKNKAFDGADLCMEVVSGSPEDRQRDYVDKRADYASAGVKEYWVIDRFERQLTVFRGDEVIAVRDGDTYAPPLLPGFELPLRTLLELADRHA